MQKCFDMVMTTIRKKQLNNTDFSIICNNCWAGYVYRRFGLSYLTPTVGVYFFADDFIKLCSDVKGYMSKKLEFISYADSKYRDEIEVKKHTHVPIAKLGDIEIVFLHYHTPEEAAEKWYRRAKRINYDNLIFKFSQMNGCTEEQLRQFDRLDLRKKICFVSRNCETNIACAVRLKDAFGEEVLNDTIKYSSYIDLVKLINSKKVCGTYIEMN